LLDSLSFAAGWREPPEELLDFGSGVGLPGIMLAIVWPETAVRLVDRSEKRCDLSRRASRVVGIDVAVERADVTEWVGEVRAAVSRATIPAREFRPILERILAPGGRAVISGDGSAVEGYENVEILDRPTRLLMMQKS
jgi:16S rRNA (guanine527-N7)-methyltransferase